jgi:glycosyltransferase involved in cell wall biosynthesis
MTHDNQKEILMKSPSVSIVIPCYNEANGVSRSLDEIFETLNQRNDFEIIIINDGSTDKTLAILEEYALQKPHVCVINNSTNLGYGASLKKGIRNAKGDIIVITDADCTYPANQIPLLLAELDAVDMAVGARTGNKVQIPLVRRPAKWALLKYARWMAQADIKDLNSGLRVFRKKDALRFFPLLPDGFSFTSTITLAMHVNGMQVCYHPINYNKRIGKSSIRPIRDTLAFFSLVLRTTMYFRPLQVFGTLSGILLACAIGVGLLGKIYLGEVPDVATMSLVSTGLIFLGLGLIGDLLNTKIAHRNYTSK